MKTIPIGSNHRVHSVFCNLLHSSMQVTDVTVEIHDGFAIQLQDYSQDPVSRGVLRTHVQHHFGAVEQRVLRCGYLYLMHFSLKLTGDVLLRFITTRDAPWLDY